MPRVEVGVSVPLRFTVEVRNGQSIDDAVEEFLSSSISGRVDLDGEAKIYEYDGPDSVNNTCTPIAECDDCGEVFPEDDLEQNKCQSCRDYEEDQEEEGDE